MIELIPFEHNTTSMEHYYSNNSFTAFKTEDGIHIEEIKKGSYKMLLAAIAFALVALIGGFLLGFLGGKIGAIVAPIFIWGSLLIIAISVIAFVLRMLIKTDPKIIFSGSKKEVSVRGKLYAFSTIDEISLIMQNMMGRTMFSVFIKTGGKKKSLFSTAIVVSDSKEMEAFIETLNELVQQGKNKTSTEV